MSRELPGQARSFAVLSRSQDCKVGGRSSPAPKFHSLTAEVWVELIPAKPISQPVAPTPVQRSTESRLDLSVVLMEGYLYTIDKVAADAVANLKEREFLFDIENSYEDALRSTPNLS